ncbi:MAG TPA: pyridoxamine 5'-phosphate oxidase family protein [Lacibacter sp.]|nr:pyridoxamine 5'-phosphate oxidase family protein [Lacibacter sp.]HMO89389.1 pyridoxamine 5'-phosphate oxidase family protein [Lacibacter sp.]HMP88334.1 pyridoxamine 5'-phosphate oxidase family protein [Lacibacter sp.]
MQDVFLQENLALVDQELWRLLEESVHSFNTPFHTGAVATVFNNIPELRTVVLRRADAPGRKLFFHTDIRSPKVTHLQRQPALSWLFYHAPSRIQLRCYAQAQVHSIGPVADYGWEQSRLSSRLCYTPADAPGTFLPAPVFTNLNRHTASPELLETARRHFAVVETTVHAMDWVFLHHDGHRRAFFDYSNQLFQWKQV